MGKIRQKGQGADYGKQIERLSVMHVRILKILLAEGGLTKAEITRFLNREQEADKEPFIGGFSVSGRLSELCGRGLVKMNYEEVQLLDSKTMQFRFKKKPVWRLTPLGSRAAMSGLVEFPKT